MAQPEASQAAHTVDAPPLRSNKKQDPAAAQITYPVRTEEATDAQLQLGSHLFARAGNLSASFSNQITP